jgi:hypothetical protein
VTDRPEHTASSTHPTARSPFPFLDPIRAWNLRTRDSSPTDRSPAVAVRRRWLASSRVRGCISCLSDLRSSTAVWKPYSSKLRTLACKRQRLNRLSIRLYVPRVITRFQEVKTLVVLPFIMPPSERTIGWKGRLLVGRWRTL